MFNYTGNAYYHCDGNGNVTCLISPNQTVVAKYLYDPFGNTLAQSGPLAEANPYRFSSKEWNANSGLYYYLYRFYDPNLQRWLNRDPIMEGDGNNLYSFLGDDPIERSDIFGLALLTKSCDDGSPGAQSPKMRCALQCYNDGGVKSCAYTQTPVWNNGNVTYNFNLICTCNGKPPTPTQPNAPQFCPIQIPPYCPPFSQNCGINAPPSNPWQRTQPTLMCYIVILAGAALLICPKPGTP